MLVITNNIDVVFALDYNGDYSNVFNLSSPYSNFKNASALIISPVFRQDIIEKRLFNIDDPSFDEIYLNYIFNNLDMFTVLIQILIEYKNKPNVIILVGSDEHYYRDNITESFMRIVRKRYGIKCNQANEVEDLDCVHEDNPLQLLLNNIDEDIYSYFAIYDSNDELSNSIPENAEY